MAKVEMGILGGFSGRVGTVVGYYRRGGWYVRAYQPHIKDRRSEAQLQQRGRFKAMIQFASQATGVLRVGLREAARAAGLTEGNLFLKENHAGFGTANYANCAKAGAAELGADCSNGCRGVDFAGLRFSRGSLAGVRLVEATVDEGGALRVRWESLGGRLGDRIHIFIYCAGLRRGICAEGERGRGGVQLLLPDGYAAVGGLHVWAFAAGRTGQVSSTAYAECRPFGAPPQRPEGEGIADGQAASEADERVGFEVDLIVRDKVGIRIPRHARDCTAAGGHEAAT